MEQFKLLVLTAIVTLLIWISADSLVNETVWMPVTLSMSAATGAEDLLVRIAPDAGVHQIQLIGPRKVVDQLQQRESLQIRLRIPEYDDGLVSIPLKEMIEQQWTEMPRLSVVSVDPPSLRVQVDHWVTQAAPIAAKPLALKYEGQPQFEPREARVRLPRSRLAELNQAGLFRIEVDVDEAMRGQPTGRSVEVTVPLVAAFFGEGATVTPNSVRVSATVRADRIVLEIPTVPIRVAVSVGNLGKSIRLEDAAGNPVTLLTQSIMVTGPIEEAERLRSGEVYVYGLIQLKDSDFDTMGVVRSFTPEFPLPPEVELAKKPEPIEFKIVKTGP